ncbi:acyl-CoA thioesterase [Micromonospora sp. LOL_021]|uniref:acyl-CoA thioesterase n=1 Tax=Micromonospora sp. LOL_021 TaxID=3345417 RepID=UPI003A845FE6
MTFDETNLVGNVYFAHFLHWQGHCRERFLADHAPRVVKALQGGELGLVTVSCTMDYFAECFALDVVDVQMTMRSSGSHRVEMNFRFCRDGMTVAAGRQTVACLGRDRQPPSPVPLPPELLRAAEMFPI